MRIKNAFRSSSIAVSVVALLLAAPAGRAAEVSATPLPSLAPLVEAVKGSVVNVEVQSKVTGPRLSMGDNPDDFFWAIGAQSPVLLYQVIMTIDAACRPTSQSKPRPVIRLVDRKPE